MDTQQLQQQLGELRDVFYRKTGPSPVGISGQTIIRNSITNYVINPKSKTYDAIVDAAGNADYKTIEAAVSYTESIGGGDIFVWGGTYTPSAKITITKPTNIVGQNSALVTVNFNSTARNFTINSGTAYTTGTITVASGTAITGSGTSWLANVTAGQYLFLGTRWYLIAAVTSDTTLVLAESYGDNVTLPSAYRIATLTRNVSFEGMTIKNSTVTGIDVTDCRDFFLKDVALITNNKGLVLTNVSQIDIQIVVCAGSTSNGAEFANCGLGGGTNFAVVNNGGHGVVVSVMKTIQFLSCSFSSNTTDGLNITSADVVTFASIQFRSNGGQGAEVVATSNRVVFNNCDFDSNTSDGLKLTASADFCKIKGNHFDNNGGWAINIANANCDKNSVVGNSYNANVSGTLTDSGTSTVNTGNTT